MASYDPQGTVTINGVSFTSKTINAVQITYGRSNVWEQARAGYANIEIVNTTDVDNNFQINQSVVITIKNSAGVTKTVFTGKITDVTASMDGSGNSGEAAIQTITAVAPFAEMARQVVGDAGYPVEYDDVRMTTILTETGVTIDVVDSPGDYEFAAVAGSPTDGYSLAAKYATMAFGYIYETTDGKVGYANESHRSVYVAANGWVSIPESYVLWQGITSNLTLNNILNYIKLTYSAGTVTSQDTSSQTSYGTIAASVQTQLNILVEAQNQADRYVANRAQPQTSLSSFTIPLDSSVVSDANRDALILVFMGMPITITGLPVPILASTYYGFVEGWVMSFTQHQLFLTVTTSDATMTLVPTRWQDVSASLIWSAVGATVTWATYDN